MLEHLHQFGSMARERTEESEELDESDESELLTCPPSFSSGFSSFFSSGFLGSSVVEVAAGPGTCEGCLNMATALSSPLFQPSMDCSG